MREAASARPPDGRERRRAHPRRVLDPNGMSDVDVPAARRGLLAFLNKQGGSLPMRELHTHSLLFYRAGPQAFSELMEGLVGDGLVTYDDGTFTLTDAGRGTLAGG